MCVTGFIDSFLPNFAATLAGVLISIYVAFCVDSYTRSNKDKSIKADENQKLASALKVLNAALTSNLSSYKKILALIHDDLQIYDSSIDYSAWESCSHLIIPYLLDTNLLQAISYHFARAERVYDLIDRYCEIYMKGHSVTQHSDTPFFWGSSNSLKAACEELVNSANELQARIEEVIKKI